MPLNVPDIIFKIRMRSGMEHYHVKFCLCS